MSEENAIRPEAGKAVRIEYYHSSEGSPKRQQEIVRELGFETVGQVIVFKGTKTQLATEMVAKVPHLIRIIE
jgi:ribosomal protein L30/L7E